MAVGDMSHWMQQAQKLQKDMREIQQDLKTRTVLGESGAGMVKVYVSGTQDVLRIELDPKAIDPNEKDVLEDLILVALRSGLEKSRELQRTEMSRVTGGISIPGMF